MILRKSIMLLLGAFLISGMALVRTSSAAIIGDVDQVGYTYMGGWRSITTKENDTNPPRYVLAQPLEYLYDVYDQETGEYVGTADMWGYGWIKFDNLADAPVESAYMAVDLLKVGGMGLMDATEEYPGDLTIYNPGDTDVATLGKWTSSHEENEPYFIEYHNYLKNEAEIVADKTVMPQNGTYYIDITNIYNGWVTGTIDNNGLILVSDSENSYAVEQGAFGCVGAKFAAFNNPDGGHAPYITTNPVPVPAAIWMLGSGLVGMIGLRRRN